MIAWNVIKAVALGAARLARRLLTLPTEKPLSDEQQSKSCCVVVITHMTMNGQGATHDGGSVRIADHHWAGSAESGEESVPHAAFSSAPWEETCPPDCISCAAIERWVEAHAEPEEKD